MSKSEKNELDMVQYMWFKHSLMKQSVTKRSRREGGKENINKLKDDWMVTKKYIFIEPYGNVNLKLAALSVHNVLHTCIPNNVIKTNKFLKLKKKIVVSGSRKRFCFHLSEVKLSIFVTFYKQLKGAKLKK